VGLDDAAPSGVSPAVGPAAARWQPRDQPVVYMCRVAAAPDIPELRGRARLPGAALHAVTLIGAARMGFHVARRCADRRGAVRALIEVFEALPADTLS